MFDGYRGFAGEEKYQLDVVALLACNHCYLLSACVPSALIQDVMFSNHDVSTAGTFGRKQMQKPFEDATYALKVGELSEIVDTDSGVHVILRTAWGEDHTVSRVSGFQLALMAFY